LPTEADVVIIGSGITGAFAAHYLATGEHGRDIDVVMLEAREAAWGATGRVSKSLHDKLSHSF
jgi:glycine/D-amino acid oxidase-like deaminating enzyme